MPAASNFISVVGYIGLSAVTGAAAGVIVLTGIFTPLSIPVVAGLTLIGWIGYNSIYKQLTHF